MIYVIADVRIRPGTLEAFAAIAQSCITLSRQEPGCRRYDLHASITDPEGLVFVAQWESREALDAHYATPHLAEFQEANKAFVVASRVEVIHPGEVERLSLSSP